ncbi:uncharacterized protein LOC123541852 [Mercenaria mercenaria]|uniref:uncharacterized protein LOC123541852 n=1 Tax=Mercenaria mercenaria TaxID=6596 RepID=UPI00234E5D75|nr:uncharacterized protein LOC123541852 [Mercenaria mercenaria]
MYMLLGRAKFDLGNNETLLFASGEDEEIEVDEEYLDHLEAKSLLIVKGERDASGHDDDDGDDRDEDDNDDDDDGGDDANYLGEKIFDICTQRNVDLKLSVNLCLQIGNQVRGRNSERVDTVIDNADMNKWWIVQEDAGVKQHILKHGLKGITSVLSVNMNVWKSKPLNIAVTGESGKGKSSFINAFRGLSAGDKGAAKIDEVECTRDCRAFRHPKYDSFVLWDVPGVGTNTFPKEKYLDAIQIDRFDFFMIVSSTRFFGLETWLAKEVMKRKKKILLYSYENRRRYEK